MQSWLSGPVVNLTLTVTRTLTLPTTPENVLEQVAR
jgi:hypothetical protein